MSDFSDYLLTYHFIPNIPLSPQVTVKHNLKPAFYFLTSKMKMAHKQKKKKKEEVLPTIFGP